jgi:hypothetical protein
MDASIARLLFEQALSEHWFRALAFAQRDRGTLCWIMRQCSPRNAAGHAWHGTGSGNTSGALSLAADCASVEP